ncbi:MAG: glycosyltransferase family 39 protein [Gemmatimonadota bacterium]
MGKQRKRSTQTTAPPGLRPGPGMGERRRGLTATPAWRWGVPAALLLVGLALGAWTFDRKLGLSGDNTEFITLARSLARGQGLSYILEPSPTPATKYPFGFPLMLAPFAAGAGEAAEPVEDWIGMKWLVVVLFAASLPLFYRLARGEMDEVAGLAATALVATNPLVVDYGHQVMSEIPYLTFSVAALYLLQRGLEPGRREFNGWLVGGFALGVWSYYLRTVGVVLLGALVLHLAWQRQFRRAGAAVGATAAALLPWMLRNRAVGGGSVYLKQLVQVNPYYPDQGLLDLGGLWDRVVSQGAFYLQHGLPQALVPFLGPADAVLNPLSVLLLATAGYAAFACLRRRQHLLLLLYTAFYLGTVLLWPWPGDRFLVPIVPLLLFFAVRAATELVGVLGRVGGGPAAGVAALALAAALVWGNAGGLHDLARRAAAGYPPPWRNYYAAAQWLRSNAPADAVVCARKAFWLYVTSGRRAVPYAFVEPAALVTELDRHRVSYVVVEQLGFRQTPMFLVPAIQAYPDRFGVVWKQPDPDTFVLTYRAGD